jgi:hypothetical protein
VHSISQTTHRGPPLLWPALAHSPQQAPAHWPLFPTPSRTERGRADARPCGGPGCGRESHSGGVTGSREEGAPHRQDSDRRQGRRKATSFGHCTSQATMSNDTTLAPFGFLKPLSLPSLPLPLALSARLSRLVPVPALPVCQGAVLPSPPRHECMCAYVSNAYVPFQLSRSLLGKHSPPTTTCVPNMSASGMPTVSSTCAISQESSLCQVNMTV